MVALWLIVACIALVGELHTHSFHAVYESAAAVLTAAVAFAWSSLLGQLVAFAVFSVILLGLVRPRMVEYLVRARPKPTLLFPDLADKQATVRARVTDFTGLVEVGAGEFWTARAYPPGETFEPGSNVVVAYRVGIRLFVQAPNRDGSP